MSFLKKLISGELGLRETFWVYSIFIPFLFTVFVSISGLLFQIALIYPLYLLPVSVGLWNAASKYSGNKLLIYAAKIGATMQLLQIVAIWYVFL